MKTEVKEKLHFKKYLIFLIGYFTFILIYFIYDIVTGVFSLKEIIDLIILLLALILFTIYTLKDFNLKKDKLLLNQKSSWLKVKIYNSLTWIFSFIAIIYLSFTAIETNEYDYSYPPFQLFAFLALLTVVLSNLSFNKIFSKKEGMNFLFFKISLLTVFAGGLTIYAFGSILFIILAILNY